MDFSLSQNVLGRSESTTFSIPFRDWLRSWREALPESHSVALAEVQVGRGRRILDVGGMYALLAPG